MQRLFLAALFAFGIDQFSKYYVMRMLGMVEGDRLDIFPPLLVFKFGWNPGINFGLFSDSPDIMRGVLVTIAVTISILLILWARRTLSRTVTLMAAGLIVGGALANALDRVIFGAVVDFLNMSCCGIVNPYIFNIADIFIFAGAFLLVAFDDQGNKANAS